MEFFNNKYKKKPTQKRKSAIWNFLLSFWYIPVEDY